MLDGTNSVFARLMTEAVGGIRYDSAAALYLGAEMPQPEEEAGETEGAAEAAAVSPGTAGTFRDGLKMNTPELILLDTDMSEEGGEEKETELTGRELEAHAAADCIRELMEREKVWDRDAGAFPSGAVRGYRDSAPQPDRMGRGVCPGADGRGHSGPYGIENRVFTTIEIQTLLNLLRVVDNPRQDIPLAAVLKSMIGGFSDLDLAQIRSAFPEKAFYESCMRYREEGEDAALRERLAKFWERLRGYRERAEFLAIHELIEELLEDTGYGDYLAAQPGGRQRQANVRMLIQRALAFEKTSYRGLFHFVRYIEQLQSYNEDFGEAGILGENEDAVRIMTIHKSKGLEVSGGVCGRPGKKL